MQLLAGEVGQRKLQAGQRAEQQHHAEPAATDRQQRSQQPVPRGAEVDRTSRHRAVER
jgi:hypothetical protein